MEIRQLKYFVSVAETGSFSEASRQCYLSQSAISQQIKLLEDELGSPLFLRTTHRVALTAMGDELLPKARQALKSFHACQEHIADLKGVICGQLNLGMTYAMEPYVRHTMAEMFKRYPRLHVNAFYATTPELRKMLVNHEVDLAFTINTAAKGEGIESHHIVSYKICAAMKRTHPLASRDVLTFDDLATQGFIMPERNSLAVRTLEKYLNNDLGKLNVRSFINSPNAILNLLQETHLVSLLSEGSILSRPSLVAKEIKELSTPIPCYVHNLKDVCMKNSAKVFMKVMHEEVLPFCECSK